MSQPLKVLIVEDSEDDAKLALRALRGGGFEPASRRVETAEDLKTALAQERWDAVISDFNMPGFTGMDALNIFRATGLDIPFILISGHIGETAAVNAIKSGASDCIMKKSLTRLPLALERELKETHMRAVHRRTQEALRRSENLKAAILESSLDCIITIDQGGTIVEFNPAAEATFGWPREHALGKAMVDLIVPPRLRDAHTRGFAHYLATGEGPILGKRLELEAMRADGTEFPIELTITAVGAASEPMFTGFIRDITAHKQASNELRESERRFRDLLGNIEMVSLMLDANGRITHCNDYLLRLTGWRREEVLGGDWFELFIPPELTALRDVRAALLANEPHAWHHENEILTRSGERRLIRWNNSLLRSGAGEVIGTASIGEDITEQKRAETGIKRLNRVYAVLSGINSLIVRVKNREELYREACQIATEAGGFRMSLIAIYDEAARTIVPVASAGKDEELLTIIKEVLSSSDDAPRTMVARAIKEKRPIVSNDSQNDSNVVFRRKYTESGVRSLAVLPLIVTDVAVGVLALYASEAEFFHEEELKLLTGLASDVAFAIDHISKEEKIARLSRIQAVMSGINSLIVRVRGRQELFDGACRVAVDLGGFAVAWMGVLNPTTREIRPVAGAGIEVDAFLTRNHSTTGVVARAVSGGQVVFSNDLTTEPEGGGERRKEAIRRGYHSSIVLPLMVEGAAMGNLSLYAKERNVFSTHELNLLNEVARNLSFALEHIGKEEKIARLSRIQAVMSGINALIVHVHDRQELFDAACRIAVENGNFGAAWIGLFDSSSMRTVEVAWSGQPLHPLGTHVSSDVAGSPGVASRAIREKQVTFDNDIAAPGKVGGERRALTVQAGFRSMVALPFMVEGAVVAHLSLYAKEPDFFNEDELKLLTDLASNISFALEHIGKEEKIVRLSRIQAVTGGINALMVRVHERQELFNGACRIAVEQGNFAMAWIGTLDPVTGDVTPIAWAGENAEEVTRAKSSAREDSPRGKGAVGQAIRQRRPVHSNDIAAHGLGGPRLDEILKLGFRSQITLPLFEGEAVVGTLTMYVREPNYFDEEELRLLTGLSGDISFAVSNISRQHKLDKLARIRAVSGEINAAIIRIHEREELLRETCSIAVEHGKFQMVWIALIDQEKQLIHPVAWSGFSPEIAHQMTWASVGTRDTTLVEVMRTRKVAVRNEFDPALPLGILRREAMKNGHRSTVCVPFMVDGSVVAAIVLFAPERDFFDPEELALLNEVAANLSFALQAIDKQGRLDYLAYYDVLTGLANRSLFLERVAQYIRGAVSGGHKLAVGLIDLERFKNINDSLGQPAGDSLLKQVAEWLTFNLGDANLVARMDADHFAVVLPEITQDGSVARLIEKLMAAFLEHPFRLDDAVFRIAVKAGVACFPDDGADAGTIFRNAEAALKKAKASGERYLFYTQQMTATVAARLTLETQLRQALDNEEFVLHYQPKVSLDTGKITGAEALIRWNDPRTGLVPPGQFIPIMEETGLIYDVGRWALRKAIADYLRWRNAGLPAVRIAVNVSPLQLRNRAFIAEIKDAIGIGPKAAAGLELELTESLIMEDVKHSIASLQAIRALGVSIAIDDFGTGFSSLSYLSKLPVDTLKIDRSFVTDMTAGPEGLALVSTVITLAHSLKLKVVAEGVETEEQSRLLRLLDCDEMQGFLFSRPVPIGIFEARYLAPPPGEVMQACERFAPEPIS